MVCVESLIGEEGGARMRQARDAGSSTANGAVRLDSFPGSDMTHTAPVSKDRSWRPTSSRRSRVLDLLSTRREFFSLPQEFYTDPEVYQMDLEAIFHKRWIFAGAECEIPIPGEYFTLTIGPTPILVLRDRAGASGHFSIHAGIGGRKSAWPKRERSGRLVCPYHQWTYDLTGRLVATGRMHEGFDREEYALDPSTSERRAGQSMCASRRRHPISTITDL